MTVPALDQLSAFLGSEPRTVDLVDGAGVLHEQHFEYTLNVGGSKIVWRISPALGHCQFVGVAGAESPIEAFVKCDEIFINTDGDEAGPVRCAESSRVARLHYTRPGESVILLDLRGTFP